MWSTVGQKRALALFENSLRRGRPAHAYLLVGPAHVGKMTLARDLAMALNCQRGVPPCGECASCRRISAATHSDVQVIGLGKNADGKQQTEIGIEDIRQMQHSANLPPFEGKCKVFIIDGAELLSIEAANCLLKTLEEPAPTVVFVLLTAKEELLPLTVVSRSSTTAEIDTFINEVSKTRTNIAMDRRSLSRPSELRLVASPA